MMALTVIGGVFQAMSMLAEASARKEAADYNAAVQDRNAAIAVERGAAESQRQDRLNRMKLGALKASFGDAGIGFEGDALTIFQDAATQTELDKQTIRYNAKLQAIGHSDQAELDRMEGRHASTAGILGAFGSIVGTGRSILKAA